jgi:hypothetical protein
LVDNISIEKYPIISVKFCRPTASCARKERISLTSS